MSTRSGDAHEIGVRDRRAGERDRVGDPRSDEFVSLADRIDPACHQYRHVWDGLLDACGQVPERGRPVGHVGDLCGERGGSGVGRVTDVHEVEPVVVDEFSGQIPHHAGIKPAIEELVSADPDAERDSVAWGRMSDRIEDPVDECSPPRRVATPRVITGIRRRGEELLQQMPMAGVDLDPVEPGGDDTFGRLSEASDEVFDFVGLHLVWDRRAAAPRQRARTPRGDPCVVIGGLATRVQQLREDRTTFSVHCGDEALQAGDAPVVPDGQRLRATEARGVDPESLRDDQPETACRSASVVLDVPVGDLMGDAEVRRVSGDDRSVAQSHRAH